jgi:hypothetical protein
MEMKHKKDLLNLIQKNILDEIDITSDLIYKNNFIVEIPEKYGIRFFDVMTVTFTCGKMCTLTIRNNVNTLQSLMQHKYKRSILDIFRLQKDDIFIHYLDKSNKRLFTKILKNIKIVDFCEGDLSYQNNAPNNSVVTIKYDKEIIINQNDEEIYKTHITKKSKNQPTFEG